MPLVAFWRRRMPEPDDSDRSEVLRQLRFARELASRNKSEHQADAEVGPALAAWFGETSLYIESVLGEQAREVFEAPVNVRDRAALVRVYLSRIDQLIEQIPDADLRFVGKELRAYGERWRGDLSERMSAGSHWTRAAAE